MKHFLENLNKYWVAPIVAIVGGLLGLYFTTVKDNLEATATRIETELRQREFTNSLKLQMYGEVKDAVMKKDADLQGAVLLIVNEMLADDSLFRNKLIRLLETSPNTDTSVKSKVQAIEASNMEFWREEQQSSAGKLRIDVFYLEDFLPEAQKAAQGLANALNSKLDGSPARTRRFPHGINAQSSFMISANEIRFAAGDDSTARIVKETAASRGIPVLLRVDKGGEPDHIKVYIRKK